MIKGLTELCLDVFIQLMSKMAGDCLTFITINCSILTHLRSFISHSASWTITSIFACVAHNLLFIQTETFIFIKISNHFYLTSRCNTWGSEIAVVGFFFQIIENLLEEDAFGTMSPPLKRPILGFISTTRALLHPSASSSPLLQRPLRAGRLATRSDEW